MNPMENCGVCGKRVDATKARPLANGWICPDCIAGLSPYYGDYEQNTIAQVRGHLAYRAQNKAELSHFRPSLTFVGSKNVYVDPYRERFIVTENEDWRGDEPDVLRFSQVSVYPEIRECRRECLRDGRPFTECDYAFLLTLHVDAAWFYVLHTELGDGTRPEDRDSALYRTYERQLETLTTLLRGLDDRYRLWGGDDGGRMRQCGGNGEEKPKKAPAVEPGQTEAWRCPSCGSRGHSGRFCEECGAIRPAAHTKATVICCPSCGNTMSGLERMPKFCSACGNPLPHRC